MTETRFTVFCKKMEKLCEGSAATGADKALLLLLCNEFPDEFGNHLNNNSREFVTKAFRQIDVLPIRTFDHIAWHLLNDGALVFWRALDTAYSQFPEEERKS